MLSKAKVKYIRSLEIKKIRRQERLFVAEGPKLISELAGHFPCRMLLAQPEWLQRHPHVTADEIITVTPDELSKASFLKTPQEVLSLFEQRESQWDTSLPTRSLCLALDDIQDPGNLGTIIRLADWFGIRQIYCSTNTVDVYSPKVVQACMGGLARVGVSYGALEQLIASLGQTVPVYGTFLNGENIYKEELSTNGIIVMGNEGNGISPEIASLINRRLYIPNYPIGSVTSESLNVAIATAVVCAEFRRRLL